MIALLAFIKASPWRIVAIALLGLLLAQTARLLNTRADAADARTELADLKTNHAEERQRAAAVALNSYTRMQGVKDAAIKDAESRNAQLTRDASDARTAAGSLRRDLAAAPARIAAATSAAAYEAVAEYGAAASLVLDQCLREYQGLAEIADGHASDVRTLSDAWPVNEPMQGP